MSDHDELARLRAENERLVALLQANGIGSNSPAPESITACALSTREKVALFRRLFRGRTDVYAVRWQSNAGKSGYAPACANEWRPGICEKPRIKCADCTKRQLMPLTDQAIYDHLAGRHTIGIYPLLVDDSCHLLAIDLDGAQWRDDAQAVVHSCGELGVPVALEVSRSGLGAHVWVFFSAAVAARDARRLGTAIISYTCARSRLLKLTSYDRLFPNQDTMPKGGFGNLIAGPLQKAPREKGASVFVDGQMRPFEDQWGFLAAMLPMHPRDIEPAILRATNGSHPLDVSFITEEDQSEPWRRSLGRTQALPRPLPAALTVTLGNLVYFERAHLPQPLSNRLVRLAAFQNPEFHKAQAMRLPVWNEPRVIGCAENFPQHIALPRGCLDAAKQLLRDNDIQCDIRDERYAGESLEASFAGALRPDQEEAVNAMLSHDTGVLCAPTAFGKTVTAAALIARRAVNTLVLVHRTELLNQWQQRLTAFLATKKDAIGIIGAGKVRPTGHIDVATMQSLYRGGEANPLVERYGQVIVDECHHISAFSFEALLKRARARYVVGLTATPMRRDGRQPIIFMQCGPIRHTALRPVAAPQALEVVPRLLTSDIRVPADAPIQDVFRHIAADIERTTAIADEIANATREGHKVLVLTERTEHVEALRAMLANRIDALFTLHGRLSKKQRAMLIADLEALPADAPRVLLSTGKLVGEGFDHAPLDTLVLAMPISWKGTLQQYAGRLHREHANKNRVRVIDFVDAGHPALMRMWSRRQRGYQAIGYRVAEAAGAQLELT